MYCKAYKTKIAKNNNKNRTGLARISQKNIRILDVVHVGSPAGGGREINQGGKPNGSTDIELLRLPQAVISFNQRSPRQNECGTVPGVLGKRKRKEGGVLSMLDQRVECLKKAIGDLVSLEVELLSIDFDCLYNCLRIQVRKWNKELLGNDYQIKRRGSDMYPYQQEKTINGATFFKLLTWDELEELKGESDDGNLRQTCS